MLYQATARWMGPFSWSAPVEVSWPRMRARGSPGYEAFFSLPPQAIRVTRATGTIHLDFMGCSNPAGDPPCTHHDERGSRFGNSRTPSEGQLPLGSESPTRLSGHGEPAAEGAQLGEEKSPAWERHLQRQL